MRFKPMEKLLFFMALSTFLVSGGLLVGTGFTSHHKPQIAFTSGRDGNAEIYVMDADGKNQRRLTHHPADDSLPSWSPDGQKIAFSSYRNGGNIQIFVMGSDGQNPIRLTDGVWDDNPDWSPDGQKIAFTSHKDEGLAGAEAWNVEIYVMDSDGKNRKRLTDIIGNNFEPSWSPGSQRIAFVSSREDEWNEIYVMDADGANQKRLTHNMVSDRQPTWSPDGIKIAFFSVLEEDFIMSVMNADGTNRRNLTEEVLDGRTLLIFHPAWSPDGRTIAYESWRGDGGISEIHLITAEGEYLMRLSELHKKGDARPDWFDPASLGVTSVGTTITIWGRIKRLALNLQ